MPLDKIPMSSTAEDATRESRASSIALLVKARRLIDQACLCAMDSAALAGRKGDPLILDAEDHMEAARRSLTLYHMELKRGS